MANTQFQSLWGAMNYLLSFIGQEGDQDLYGDVAAYVALIPSWFFNFMKDSFRRCMSNISCHVRVLAPGAALEKMVDPNPPLEFLLQVGEQEAALAPLIEQVVARIDLGADPAAPAP